MAISLRFELRHSEVYQTRQVFAICGTPTANCLKCLEKFPNTYVIKPF